MKALITNLLAININCKEMMQTVILTVNKWCIPAAHNSKTKAGVGLGIACANNRIWNKFLASLLLLLELLCLWPRCAGILFWY